MHILVIENDAAEQQKAKETLEAAGHTALITDDVLVAMEEIDSCDGVITDLFFPPKCRQGNVDYGQGYLSQVCTGESEPPMGLLMVILAQARGKKVVICTDAGGHNYKVGWIYDAFSHTWSDVFCGKVEYEEYCRQVPFRWVGSKSWSHALDELERMLK